MALEVLCRHIVDGHGGLGSFLCLSDFYRFFFLLYLVYTLLFLVSSEKSFQRMTDFETLIHTHAREANGREAVVSILSMNHVTEALNSVNPFPCPCHVTLALCQR